MTAFLPCAGRLSVGDGPPQSRYVTICPPREASMRFGFGMWCVGLCLLLTGAALAQGWTAFSPEGGRYRVDMPAAPKVSTAPIPVGPGQTVPMTEAEVRLGNVGYLASWVDYPERIARAASADLMLDRIRDGSSAGNTLRAEKKLT